MVSGPNTSKLENQQGHRQDTKTDNVRELQHALVQLRVTAQEGYGKPDYLHGMLSARQGCALCTGRFDRQNRQADLIGRLDRQT